MTRDEIINRILDGGLYDCINDPVPDGTLYGSLMTDCIRLYEKAYQSGRKAGLKEAAEHCDDRAKGLLSIIGLPVVQSEIVQRDRAKVWSEAASDIRARIKEGV
jgi:hypothetical protein